MERTRPLSSRSPARSSRARSSTAVHTPVVTQARPATAPLASWPRGSDQMFMATLCCGTVLSYEAPTFGPRPGDLVPCRHHGYCTVKGTSGTAASGAFSRRGRSRAQGELLEWLRDRKETTVHALRRHGFT